MKFTLHESKRIEILSKHIAGLISAQDAATVLGIKERQFRRLKKAFLEVGHQAVVHGNKGKVPANKTPIELENNIISFYKRNSKKIPSIPYLHQKLIESPDFDIVPSQSVLRRILVSHNLCRTYSKRARRPSKKRDSYEREGIMVQMDGSYHKWFGHSKSCLICIIDDATSKILAAKFCKHETTFDCMDVIQDVLDTYGRFEILYTDKAGIYSSYKREGYSHVENAMTELDILSLTASTPQAKGRIERLFRTLQLNLVADLAWANIDSMEEANKYINEIYIPKHNKKFAVQPVNPVSAFRPLDHKNIDEVLCKREMRKIAHGEIFSFNANKYVISGNMSHSLKGYMVEIRIYRDHTKKFFVKGKQVQVHRLRPRYKAA